MSNGHRSETRIAIKDKDGEALAVQSSPFPPQAVIASSRRRKSNSRCPSIPFKVEEHRRPWGEAFGDELPRKLLLFACPEILDYRSVVFL